MSVCILNTASSYSYFGSLASIISLQYVFHLFLKVFVKIYLLIENRSDREETGDNLPLADSLHKWVTMARTEPLWSSVFRIFVHISHVAGRGPGTWTILCCFSKAISRKLEPLEHKHLYEIPMLRSWQFLPLCHGVSLYIWIFYYLKGRKRERDTFCSPSKCLQLNPSLPWGC